MAILWTKELDPHTRLGIWKIEESIEELKGELVLSLDEIAFVESLRKGKRTLHWLASRVLLRRLLELDAREVLDTRLDEFDKPFIYNRSRHFSISHSFDFAAVMVGEVHLVGCDIEQINPKIVRIADKFLSKAEIDFLDPAHFVHQLYVCWSAKEAVYKMYGRTNVSFKENILLHPFLMEAGGVVKASLCKSGFFKTFDVHYELVDGYMLAYVSG